MFENLDRPAHIERREYKKLMNVCRKFHNAYQSDMFEFFKTEGGILTSRTIPFIVPEIQKIIDEFNTLAFTVKEMKDLTREDGYDKMCIEQELLGGCDSCPYFNYCGGFGKALR